MKWFGKNKKTDASRGQDAKGKCGHCGKDHKTSQCPEK